MAEAGAVNMSPELLLKCAQKIAELEAFGVTYVPVLDGDRVILKDTRPITKEQYGEAAPLLEFPSLVFELSNKSWQMDLQEALEREGWLFGFREDFGFMATFDGKTHIEEINAPTKPELLAQCVECW